MVGVSYGVVGACLENAGPWSKDTIWYGPHASVDRFRMTVRVCETTRGSRNKATAPYSSQARSSQYEPSSKRKVHIHVWPCLDGNFISFIGLRCTGQLGGAPVCSFPFCGSGALASPKR